MEREEKVRRVDTKLMMITSKFETARMDSFLSSHLPDLLAMWETFAICLPCASRRAVVKIAILSGVRRSQEREKKKEKSGRFIDLRAHVPPVRNALGY